jgi:hypothetical protein
MTWEEDLSINEEGDGDWSDKPADDTGGALDPKEEEDTEEKGYDIDDKDLEAGDGLEEDLN